MGGKIISVEQQMEMIRNDYAYVTKKWCAAKSIEEKALYALMRTKLEAKYEVLTGGII